MLILPYFSAAALWPSDNVCGARMKYWLKDKDIEEEENAPQRVLEGEPQNLLQESISHLKMT